MAYSGLEKLLHRLALGLTPVAELSFDMDQKAVRADGDAVRDAPHVFVSGLARAGTTILMRRFHASGGFRSLTYRDMPFVLAPNLWARMSGQGRKIAAAERAHGDRIAVDADSPEALDEVFWRIFAGPEYIAADHLHPHRPDPETTRRFRAYVAAILAGAAPGARYLSKNNNNILRLGTIRAAFPNALIVVPVREPLAHAGSLLRQHVHFSAEQAGDPFVRSYMGWLAHHEFGLGHRPFRFAAQDTAALAVHDRETIDYWLTLWFQTYDWLSRNAPEDSVFVPYEALCADPGVWEALAARAGVAKGGEDEPFRASTAAPPQGADPALAARATALYDRLAARAGAVSD